MPVKIFGKTYENFAAAKKAATGRAGIKNPAAYVATVERAENKGKMPKKGGKR